MRPAELPGEPRLRRTELCRVGSEATENAAAEDQPPAVVLHT